MSVVVIAHNIRSTHNVGAILRSSDAFGVQEVYCSGYTPYPVIRNDSRLPHESLKLTTQISKTALGAEKTVPISYEPDIRTLLKSLKHQGYQIVGLEQDARSKSLKDFKPAAKLALLLGEEVAGISPELREMCDEILEIPMHGQKESLNVSVATGIALFQLTT